MRTMPRKAHLVPSPHPVRKLPTPRLSAVQPALLGQMNEQAVLRLVQSYGPMSRIEIARQLGFTAPTASKAADSLLQAGWLEEEDEAAPMGRGRPAKRLHLPGKRAQVVGVVIDAFRCQVVAAGLDGAIPISDNDEAIITFDTPTTYEALIEQIIASVQTLVNRPDVRTFGIGISLPGLVDPYEQRGILSPNLPLTDGRSPADDICASFEVPCVQVQEENALCLAERAYGKARGYDDFAMLDIATGVGLGVVSGGQLLTGHRGLAGELGHITVVADEGRLCGCGNHGCLETETSETGLARRVSDRLGRSVSVEELARLIGAFRADKSAEPRPVWADDVDRFLRYLAIGVATVINLFNVSAIFLHSRILAVSPMLFDRLVEETKRRALSPSFGDCEIVLAQGSKPRAAVAAIMNHLIEALVPTL